MWVGKVRVQWRLAGPHVLNQYGRYKSRRGSRGFGSVGAGVGDSNSRGNVQLAIESVREDGRVKRESIEQMLPYMVLC